MNTSRLAVVYVRVSTEYPVDNYSVRDQRSLASLAGRYGFERVEIREEQGVSAETITARPVMKGILEEISNETIGAIIVASFTRLTLSLGYKYKWKEETSAKGTRFVADLAIDEEEAQVVRYIHELVPNYLYR